TMEMPPLGTSPFLRKFPRNLQPAVGDRNKTDEICFNPPIPPAPVPGGGPRAPCVHGLLSLISNYRRALKRLGSEALALRSAPSARVIPHPAPPAGRRKERGAPPSGELSAGLAKVSLGSKRRRRGSLPGG